MESFDVICFVGDLLQDVKSCLNGLYETIFLIIGMALLVHGIHRLVQQVPTDGVWTRVKGAFFRNAKKNLLIKMKIKKELAQTEKSLSDHITALFKGENDCCHFVTEIPSKGLESQDIIGKVSEYLELGDYVWMDGAVSGTVYHGGKELTELNAQVYKMSTWTNPLHPDVFPGICKMEGEIVRIVADLFHGGLETCGVVTSGGTESILLAVKAYRDLAVDQRGLKYPEILAPITAHPAFDKAAQLLNLRIKHVPIDETTCTVDIPAMESMITKNTIMLVGSTPAFPGGCLDNIEAIAELGQKYNIPVHVDACLGGFLLAFMPMAGFTVPPFDFLVPGVTSISADTHKYGFAPKGSSVLLYKEKKYKHYQYFMQLEWPGGLYASPTLAGSRPGALIAGCWATLMHFGLSGYVDTTRRIVKTARDIQEKLREIGGIYVIGNPQVSVVAFGSRHFDIYRLQDGLKKKGWNLNALQYPMSIQFCLTYCQTQPGVADRFIKDVQSLATVLMKDPVTASTGTPGIYGSSQQITERSLIGEITALYIDKLYETTNSGSVNKVIPSACNRNH